MHKIEKKKINRHIVRSKLLQKIWNLLNKKKQIEQISLFQIIITLCLQFVIITFNNKKCIALYTYIEKSLTKLLYQSIIIHLENLLESPINSILKLYIVIYI